MNANIFNDNKLCKANSDVDKSTIFPKEPNKISKIIHLVKAILIFI